MTEEIANKYQKLDDIEHVLKRPGMYVGSTTSEVVKTQVYDETGMVEKEIENIPAVLKLFDEIISNSVDEHLRTKNSDHKLNHIWVKLDNTGAFQCWDNGGIPVVMHPKEQVYIPELIFGNLRSGANFNDNEKREVVGTNGVGSSLANIFSTNFNVETADGSKKCIVNWTDHMNTKSVPKISNSTKKYTDIKFNIDMEYFKLDEIPIGIMKLVEKRCIVAAASNPGLKITFNDQVFKFKSFYDYIKLYGEVIIGETNPHWQIYMIPKAGSQGGRSHGVVNGAECNGGTHTKMLNDWITWAIEGIIKKKKFSLTKNQILQQFDTFVCISVDKPTYDSQSKERLTNDLQVLDSGGTKRWLTFSDKFYKQIAASDLINDLERLYNSTENEAERAEVNRQAKSLNKVNAKKIRKLIDATGKGKKARQNASIFLFEGQSASSGFRSARVPETQGCYSFKGRTKNTVGMSTINILANQEFSDIIVALGIDVRNPDDLSKLRYKRIIIATDADTDGFAIAASIMALFCCHFPAIVEAGMLYRAVTPIAKAKKAKRIEYFYDADEYRKFMSSHKGWKSLFLKGLGSLEKVDYNELVRNTKLEQYNTTTECLETIQNWMGGDSSKRKAYLETPEIY